MTSHNKILIIYYEGNINTFDLETLQTGFKNIYYGQLK